MKYSAVLLLGLILGGFTTVTGQDTTADRLHAGAELDALPWLSDGYYASLWAGRDGWRVRGVVASLALPSFAVPAGYRDLRIHSYTLLVDYFFTHRYEGFWIGGGFEYWHSSIRSSTEDAGAEYDNGVVTAGGGYVWRFYRSVYLNPWGAVHLRAAGAREVSVGYSRVSPAVVSGEVSLKLGIEF